MRLSRRTLLPAALVAAAALAAPLTGLAAAAPAAAATLLDSALHGSSSHAYRIVAGPIRNTGSGWQAIVNTTHSPTGIGTMSTSGTTITMRYSFRATKIVSFVVTPDETLAKAGVFSGASVDVDAARITIADAHGALDPTKVTTKQYPYGNLWVYGVFEVAG